MKNKYINTYYLNYLLFAISVLSTVILFFQVVKYVSISQVMFGLGLILLVLLNILALLLIIGSKNHRWVKNLDIVYMILLIIVTLVGNYYLFRVNSAVDKVIVDTGKPQYEEITTSFVTYDNNVINEYEDIAGKKVGLVENETFLEGHVLPIARLEADSIKVEYVYFESYNEVLLALFSDQIEVAALPEEYYQMFIVNDGYDEYLDKTDAVFTFTEKVEITAIVANEKDLTKEPFTILLMGNDGGRTDTLIAATFNPLTMTATMTSIARDSYVPIACYKNEARDKINHSRIVSRQCTIDTVSKLLGVEVDYFAEVNFKAVVDIVDAVGGVYLNSPVEFVGQDASDERGNYTVWVGEGWQTMDGLQALAFARERHAMPNGDMDRQVHQQQVITAVIQKLLETKDINQLLGVLEAAGSNIKTNVSLKQMTSLANYVIQEMNQSSLDNFYLLQIKSTRITGYFSWAYNEPLQLPLSIYRPYNGSIADSVSIIKENLLIDYQPRNATSYSFDIFSPYYAPNLIKDTYDEKQIHEPLPDFMPNMIGSAKVWMLNDVNDWKSSRSWIALDVQEVWPGDIRYNEAYAYNQVISQSVKYGVKTANISTLSIQVIKRDLDCSIEANRQDPQCKSIVPNLVGASVEDVYRWSQDNNFGVKIIYIQSTDPNYDKTKINYVTSQKERAYEKLSNIGVSELTFYTMDYPIVLLPVDKILNLEKWTKTMVEEWYKTNMYVKAEFVYEKTNSGATVKDQVIGIQILEENLIKDIEIKGNQKVIFTLTLGPDASSETPGDETDDLPTTTP